MRKTLTEKEQHLLSLYVKYGSQVKAYREVYPNQKEKTVYSRASEAFRKIFEKINTKDFYEFSNVGLGKAVMSLNELLSASHTVIHNGKKIEIPDNSTRIRALETLVKMLGQVDRNKANEDDQNGNNDNEPRIFVRRGTENADK